MQEKVHDLAMQPLWDLIQTNYAFDLLQEMMKDEKNEVSEFRFIALE